MLVCLLQRLPESTERTERWCYSRTGAWSPRSTNAWENVWCPNQVETGSVDDSVVFCPGRWLAAAENHPQASHRRWLWWDACHWLQPHPLAWSLAGPWSKCWTVLSWSPSDPSSVSALLGFLPSPPWLRHPSKMLPSAEQSPQSSACFGPFHEFHATQEWVRPVPVQVYMASDFDRSMDSRMPLAAAIAILAETTPPPSLTFLRYSWTFVSRRTGLPRFFGGSTVTSSSSWAALFSFIPSKYAS